MLTVSYRSDPSHPAGGWFTILAPAELALISTWPGWRRWPTNGQGALYQAPAWPAAALFASRAQISAQPLRWDARATAVRDALQRQLSEANECLNGSLKLAPAEKGRQPRPHQHQGRMALIAHRGRALLTDEMGLGKTSTALWALAHLPRILVLCPVFLKHNWANELAITLGESWSHVIVSGNARQRADAFVSAVARPEPLCIILNYDLLRHLSDEQLVWLRKWVSTGGVICDEAHYLKNRDAQRTKIVSELANHAKAVIPCTGTPITNMADDLFAQVELARPGTWTSYRDFANRYLILNRVEFGKRAVIKVVGTKNLDELNIVLNTMRVGRKKADVLDLPAKTYTKPQLELDGVHASLYQAMKQFAKIEIGKLVDGGVGQATIFDPRAKTAVEAMMRCEQIAQGFLDGIPEPVMAQCDLSKHCEKIAGRANALMLPQHPKIVWLLEWIEAIRAQKGAPVIATRFNAPGDWLLKKLHTQGLKAAFLYGAIPEDRRHEIVNEFQDGKTDVLIMQVKVAAGFNLTRSQDMAFFGRDWSPAINEQTEDRLHRMGQKGTVNIQVPVVLDSIEVMLDRRLAAKTADKDQALRHLTLKELMEEL